VGEKEYTILETQKENKEITMEQDYRQARLLITKSVYEMTGEWGKAQEDLVNELLEFIYEKETKEKNIRPVKKESR
jgi:hypothetical protein